MLGGSLRTRGSMPPSQAKLYTKDEELGKRDDDFRPKKRETMSTQLNPVHWRRRRLLAIVALLVLAYLFIHNIPTGLGSADSRLNPALKGLRGVINRPTSQAKDASDSTHTGDDATTGDASEEPTAISLVEPTGSPPRVRTAQSDEISKQYYDGTIKYYRLATTLNKVSVVNNVSEPNRNVVFAASSLKSLANLLPIACEMAAGEMNSVHLVLASRSDLSVADIKAVNNLDQNQCPIEIHDARADYNEYSNDQRHEHAVAGAIAHINVHIAPAVYIVDDEAVEDKPFSRAMQRRTKDYFKTLIQIPADSYDEFMYISRLDHTSLSHWHTPTIEIIIHAPNDSAGSLMRLLRTLSNADYKGVKLPKLTIDLATTIQPALKNVLSNFKWPPRIEPPDGNADVITLRHHVQSQRLNSEQAAMRFLESYYPMNNDNHVLVLSPQVELSAQFLRYLHFNLLEYKYKSKKSLGTGELLGISLEVPSTDLSGKKTFIAPEIADKQAVEEHSDLKTAFLYQVPSSTSMLIFGDKWQVFHDYLTHRLDANHLGVADKAEKAISETEPAWLEYLYELMRARGWHVLYPAHSFAMSHNELARIPEEFDREPTSTTRPSAKATPLDPEEPFILAPEPPVRRDHTEESPLNPLTPIHQILPYAGILPKLDALPYVTFEGALISMSDSASMKNDYTVDFRKRIGGCDDATAPRARIIHESRADDLFCLPTIDMDFHVQED